MKAGDTVICIDDAFVAEFELLCPTRPQKDRVYVIREVTNLTHLLPPLPGKTNIRVLLQEIVNPPIYMQMLQGKVEPGFDSSRFKLVTTQPNKAADKESASKVFETREKETRQVAALEAVFA
jgi:hypothetical protein